MGFQPMSYAPNSSPTTVSIPFTEISEKGHSTSLLDHNTAASNCGTSGSSFFSGPLFRPSFITVT